MSLTSSLTFFFFNDTATTQIYTLSLHDALPIYGVPRQGDDPLDQGITTHQPVALAGTSDFLGLKNDDITTLRFPEFIDRKSTRLNSSHVRISYAVFCLKKKKKKTQKIYKNNKNV